MQSAPPPIHHHQKHSLSNKMFTRKKDFSFAEMYSDFVQFTKQNRILTNDWYDKNLHT